MVLEIGRECSTSLRRFLLCKKASESHSTKPKSAPVILICNKSYNLPSLEAVVNYLQAVAGFPIKSTQLKADMARSRLLQCQQIFLTSTLKNQGCHGKNMPGCLFKNPNPMSTPKAPEAELNLSPNQSHEIHVWTKHSSKFHTDKIDKLRVQSRSGTQHIMVMYHCDSNTILSQAFKNQTDVEIVDKYNTSMTSIKNNRHQSTYKCQKTKQNKSIKLQYATEILNYNLYHHMYTEKNQQGRIL